MMNYKKVQWDYPKNIMHYRSYLTFPIGNILSVWYIYWNYKYFISGLLSGLKLAWNGTIQTL